MCRHYLLLCIVIAPCAAVAQIRVHDRAAPPRAETTDPRLKDLPTGVVAAGGISVDVRKTASVVGEEVCGAVLITNTGRQPIVVSGIDDSIEVHFPGSTATPALPPGSTVNWFKVAEIPIAVPGAIAPGQTARIDYCFSLCLTADYAGANSMRNVVKVAVVGAIKTFATRSASFPPPALDCQACCLPDGSCRDTVPATCMGAGGLTQGEDTQCATVHCLQGCCLGDGNCRDETLMDCAANGGEALGLGTACATANTTCHGACCIQDDRCAESLSRDDCGLAHGTYLGNDTTCQSEAAVCPTGACCNEGSCQDSVSHGYQLSQINCDEAGGIYLGDGSVCAGVECPRPCCFNDGTCSDLARGTCLTSGGRPLNPELFADSCAEMAVVGGCPQACCFDGGHCENLVPLECSLRGGTLQGPGSNCGGVGCPRACCHDDGSCSEQSLNDCFDSGGRPQSVHDDDGGHVGLSCEQVEDRGGCAAPCCFTQPTQSYCNTIPPDECRSFGGFPRPVSLSCGSPDLCAGACCIGGTCEVMSVQDCTEQGGDPLNPGTDCGFGPLSPCSVIDPGQP